MRRIFLILLSIVSLNLFCDETDNQPVTSKSKKIDFQLINAAIDDQGRPHILFKLVCQQNKENNTPPLIRIFHKEKQLEQEKLKLVQKSKQNTPSPSIIYSYELIDEAQKPTKHQHSYQDDLYYHIKIFYDEDAQKKDIADFIKKIEIQENKKDIKSSSKLGQLALIAINPQAALDFREQTKQIIRNLPFTEQLPGKLYNWQIYWQNYRSFSMQSDQLYHALSDLLQLFDYRFDYLISSKDKKTWDSRFNQLINSLLPFSKEFEDLSRTTKHSISSWNRKFELLYSRVPHSLFFLKIKEKKNGFSSIRIKTTEKYDYQYFISRCCTAGHFMIDKLRKESEQAELLFFSFYTTYRTINKEEKYQLAKALGIPQGILDAFYYATAASRIRMEFRKRNAHS